ncbi:GTP-binding protein LepA [Lentisphaera araneosa HTCC2155]|uniref:Elongation factor 4 n=1 Tax=Lentisphaera araneosa HTCC2155 TaxID=313628 RepID=A6DLC3_9BACT|nr:translation elongation factor 4 [Lentisphaera araneosa]EDM27725.1 GTP-binding protein LepA [Lentisphaera araneosa HTCC2155]
MERNKIRNFSIIAHIDHGKSTLADRLLQMTNTVSERDMEEQLLDNMDLERERGITIKAHPVTMSYKANNDEVYELNLIDTPGHVDFAYEVSRSLAACEGAVLIIDATQGVQAQTVANIGLAMKQGLTIVPVLNKIDLPATDLAMCYEQLEEILAIPAEEALLCSAKSGEGIPEIVEAIIDRIPCPPEVEEKSLASLIVDSSYDAYRGVVNYVRVFSGEVRAKDQITMFSTGKSYEVKEVGVFTPKMKALDVLTEGSVGYLIGNIKDTADSKIGDTITSRMEPVKEALPGFAEVLPMVYSGVYPIDSADFETLRLSMGKLQLNDPSFVYQAESSAALGFGFRCGFLGLLHMEIIQERLRRHYDMDIISTYPSVIYHVHLKNGEMVKVDNPVYLPDPSTIDYIEEPVIAANIMIPNDYIGAAMSLIMEKRGLCENTTAVDERHVMLSASLPLHEIVIDFNDRLKSMTKGYGSMNYTPNGYQQAPLVKLEMKVNDDPIDAFASIVHRDAAESRGRKIAERLKDVVPRQMFAIAIQAYVGGNIVARETISAMRKNVTAKCYGGDISRKRKLLEKQKAGKKRMKQIGNVNIPQEAFVQVLKASTSE